MDDNISGRGKQFDCDRRKIEVRIREAAMMNHYFWVRRRGACHKFVGFWDGNAVYLCYPRVFQEAVQDIIAKVIAGTCE